MANSDKNIRIIPNRNSTTDTPFIRFTGQSNNPILLRVLDDNTLSFEGTAGQLLSINNNLSSGWIFAVSDISGIPSFRVNADGTIGLAEYSGNIGIGTAGATPPFKITAGTNTATSTATPLTISLGGTYSSTAGANPKLRLYYDGTNSSGFGYSNNQLESIARNTDDFVWYFGGTQKARLTAAGNLGLTAAGSVSSKLFLETNSSAQIGIVIKGSASQTGNLLEFQNSSSTILSFVNSSGSFLPTTSGLALGGSSNRWNLYATSGDFNNTVSLSPTASTTELRFYELAANGADYTAFKAPNIHEQSIIYTLPAIAPALNQVLTASSVSGGNVTLSWGASSSGTLSGGGTQYKIPMWTNSSSLGDSIITQNSTATQITVDGNFRATTKSFLIDHPSFPGKLLEHGSLEGPEHGAYVRGRASGINYVTIQLPDYWKDLVEEDYSIYITSRCNSSLFVVSQSQNSFKISRTGLLFLRKIKIEFDYYCVGDRKDQKLELVQDKV
jgi:hypothetical protein